MNRPYRRLVNGIGIGRGAGHGEGRRRHHAHVLAKLYGQHNGQSEYGERCQQRRESLPEAGEYAAAPLEQLGLLEIAHHRGQDRRNAAPGEGDRQAGGQRQNFFRTEKMTRHLPRTGPTVRAATAAAAAAASFRPVLTHAVVLTVTPLLQQDGCLAQHRADDIGRLDVRRAEIDFGGI